MPTLYEQIARLKAEIESHKIDADNLKAALANAKSSSQQAVASVTEERDGYFPFFFFFSLFFSFFE